MSTNGFGWAWLGLAAAIAIHVADEAITGFLDVYNPTVLAIRESIRWFPMPVFTFPVWLAGLVAGIALMLATAPFAFAGSRWIRYPAWVLGLFMIGNAFTHTIGTLRGCTVESVTFDGPMPGFYSSPFLVLAGVYLLVSLWRTRAGVRP